VIGDETVVLLDWAGVTNYARLAACGRGRRASAGASSALVATFPRRLGPRRTHPSRASPSCALR